ncbi:MAG TPA: hypothetical protein VK745_18705 [Polyangiaceae bacterium]|jgi:hypothetical protein|nr:hypothetical protein [Polyangiaceae bacterium]
MSKLILLSIVIATIVVPASAAREPSPRKGLRRVIIWMLLFEAFYVFALMFLFGRV